MLTGIDMDDARDLAKRVGADDYVTKPYDPEELVTKMKEVAELAWKRKHLGDGDADDTKISFTCPNAISDCG